jgi:hypothetical protein
MVHSKVTTILSGGGKSGESGHGRSGGRFGPPRRHEPEVKGSVSGARMVGAFTTARGCVPRNMLVKEGVLLLGQKKLLSLRKAFWVVCRDRAFVGLLVGPECAVLIVGEKFIFTRR